MSIVYTKSLTKVRDINWADPDINRAGIIPIYDDGTNKWIGLGVSNSRTSLTAIGGSFEPDDHDLLATAVREYNEEIGPNSSILTVEDVHNCYAIKTNYMIEILLPLNIRPTKFLKTSELNFLLWLTVTQLQNISNNLDYYIPSSGSSSKIRAFVLSHGLIELIPSLSEAINSGIPFVKVISNDSLIRPKRIVPVVVPTIISQLSDFNNDYKCKTKFIGHVGLVISDNMIGLIRMDRTIYLLSLDNLSAVLDILKKLKITVYVATIKDQNIVASNITLIQRCLKSIEHAFSFPSDNFSILMGLFHTSLFNIRIQEDEQTRIIQELNLLMDYEDKFYKLIENDHRYFNTKRYYFLLGFIIINNILSKNHGNICSKNLRRILEHKCKRYTVVPDIIISMLINMGLLVEDTENNIIKFSN
jgi:hypothetical protein